MTFQVRAIWDDEAGVWVAESEELPGLVTEAETIERLIEKLRMMVPELAELNLGLSLTSATFNLIAERQAISLA